MRANDIGIALNCVFRVIFISLAIPFPKVEASFKYRHFAL